MDIDINAVYQLLARVASGQSSAHQAFYELQQSAMIKCLLQAYTDFYDLKVSAYNTGKWEEYERYLMSLQPLEKPVPHIVCGIEHATEMPYSRRLGKNCLFRFDANKDSLAIEVGAVSNLRVGGLFGESTYPFFFEASFNFLSKCPEKLHRDGWQQEDDD